MAMIDEIKKVREAHRAADDSLFAQQNRVRAKERELVVLKRLGPKFAEQAGRLRREIEALNDTVTRERVNLDALGDRLGTLVDQLVLEQTPQQLVSQLDDRLPCVLFPLRIETRFMPGASGRELLVRVYPDDIAVHTHEKQLTRDEADAGVSYWTTRAVAATIGQPGERERADQGAWRALANAYGGTRASWIAGEIERRALEKPENQDLSFLLIRAHALAVLADPQLTPPESRAALQAVLSTAHPFAAAIHDAVLALVPQEGDIADEARQTIVATIDNGVLTYLGFDLEALKPETWSRAPRSEVMPDRLVLIGITDGVRREFPFPASIPSPLILGPNPQKLESELAQRAGDLVVGGDFAWIWDFDAAIKVGMAMRLPLPEPFASAGFDRLMVLGMHVSAEPADHSRMLEALIEDHRYSPDGCGFVRQGTPTNHTADVRSGFSTEDAEGEASFAEETVPPLPSSPEDLDKTDAQRFAEAWDVSLDVVGRLANGDGRDVSNAKLMNQALWPATFGYFFEELLEAEAAVNDRVRRFFTADVVARGSVPAIRVGKQPYGVLVTSAFGRWLPSDDLEGDDAPFLRQVHDVLVKVEAQWQQLVPQVSRVDAPGDSFVHLLNILGLQPTSAGFERRIGTYQTFLWNLAHLMIGGNFGGDDPMARYFHDVTARGIRQLGELGFQFPRLPKLFGLLFSSGTSPLNGPLVDDVATAEDEKLSETSELPATYAVTAPPDTASGDESETRNYIGWIASSALDTLKSQTFVGGSGAPLPIPGALLYRMLHRALLLASYDATMKLYEELQLVGAAVRREQDFTNVEAGRTVTRWEFMQARVNDVMPSVSGANLAIGDFLATSEGLARPAAELLREVRSSIARLEHLTTADLERLMVEHIDLCSYRLDAWQSALFARRLTRLNQLRVNPDGGPRRGVHLGAFGWLENVRPAPPAPVVAQEEIPESLREDDVAVVEQPNNGGYIHAPSMNHAVAAAVLRNGYLTHATQQDADHFAVNLTSERVRTALSFLEGVRNGQELGALLGYQFERALHDRYVIDGVALAQFILAFRKKYPLVADKVTPDSASAPIDLKESYQVVDGYALLQAVFLTAPPLGYPYGVDGLPSDPANSARQAIEAEVARLHDTLDAIADLSLAEGVFQVAQGNFARAGAMLKAMSEGQAPPEPEIVATPRGGAVVHHRIAVHLETGSVASPWPGPASPRSDAAPGLNKWLADRIGSPDSIRCNVTYDLDGVTRPVSVADLHLQPIDLVYQVGDQVGAMDGTRQINDATELEARFDQAYRLARRAADSSFDTSGRTTVLFMNRDGFATGVRTLFELLPLLRTLRQLVTTCRPLRLGDYRLPSEQTTDPALAANAAGWDLQQMIATLENAGGALQAALDALQDVLNAVPAGALNDDSATVPDLGAVDYPALIDRLVRTSLFGVAGAFPKVAFLPVPGANPPDAVRLALLRLRQALIRQGLLTHEAALARRQQAQALITFSGLPDEERNRLTADAKADTFQRAAALLLGDAFRLIPVFTLTNRIELEAARTFAVDRPAGEGLLRFTQSRMTAAAAGAAIADWRRLAVDEWLQGVASVRASARLLDDLQTYEELFGSAVLPIEPVQLPFDEKAHWIAVEFPEIDAAQLDDPAVFAPRGEFVSIVRHLPAAYSAAGPQAGLLVDEWNEVIPNRAETTGVALHYNQPNTEPPQCVLVAVSPTMRGHWEWDHLVESLVDTFDRAARRAVEPDFLRTTPYAQLLPAVLSTFTSFPFGTISTNFTAQAASLVVEGGQ